MPAPNSDYIPRGPVEATLNFFEYPVDGSVPYQYGQQPEDGSPMLNYRQPALPVSLSDMRGQEDKYTLDKDAVQTLQHVFPTIPYETFDSDEAVEQVYYPEVEKLLLNRIPGAHTIVIFDHVIRRQQNTDHTKPLFTAHADQTAKAAARRVRLSVSDEAQAEQFLQGRYRIINVWKPINGAVQSCPLAVASGAHVHPADLVPIEFRLPHRTGEIVGVRHNPQQQWLYWSGMENDECLLLKCFDSTKAPEVAVAVPHSAFEDPRTPLGARDRESIEVRALVFG
ncbi:hypothetical protein ASPWEDRAFT_114858 [Aspergillus wentii DTO 134E9]|uniref:Methyltransferase n=1 Tax=Aspergillus wentii DTO 134E9 TaxID=1073089 RepID=A0A1L9RF43_ASPWE|nr:uncharacterized protein ASPWEDRAFT_114858 [Aspergillus wentii DTO 134E9]KAI9926164.1 hypothetical protein MW887_004627 [Aspergillus wentii]OJJ33483.1 hypothetical protein ASPWEDRAFT_114858 [Aspergillus wentii DTO 134E9]